MKAKVLIVAVSVMIMAACSKDKFSTKPKLTFESINANEFATGQDISIKLKLTDKEGDFSDDESNPGFKKPYLFVKRFSYLCSQQDTTVSNYPIPAFTSRKDLDANLIINFTYGINDGQYPYFGRTDCAAQKNDSTYLKFWIKDEAGNVSDTINTATFRLLKD